MIVLHPCGPSVCHLMLLSLAVRLFSFITTTFQLQPSANRLGRICSARPAASVSVQCASRLQ